MTPPALVFTGSEVATTKQREGGVHTTFLSISKSYCKTPQSTSQVPNYEGRTLNEVFFPMTPASLHLSVDLSLLCTKQEKTEPTIKTERMNLYFYQGKIVHPKRKFPHFLSLREIRVCRINRFDTRNFVT